MSLTTARSIRTLVYEVPRVPKQKKLRLEQIRGEGRPDVVARLCMVVDWCIDHPEYTAKIKVIPKKDYPILMPCEF